MKPRSHTRLKPVVSAAKPARSQRLQVYVTPAGFFDAVVAAPNQKAALQAWGAHANLFAEGLAHAETDPEWRDKALARPGEVVRKPRGDPAALLAEPSPTRRPTAPAAPPGAEPASRPPKRPPPPPDPAPLHAAEAALEAAQARARRERDVLADRRRALEADEAEARARWNDEDRRLEADVEAARRAFRRAGGEA